MTRKALVYFCMVGFFVLYIASIKGKKINPREKHCTGKFYTTGCF